MMRPRVTVVTTVYDRVDCLARCLRAMTHSTYRDFEQIVISDAPPEPALRQIRDVVAEAGPAVRHLTMATRANDWGMTPAYTGLVHAQGEYVCFLSDDNAYLPEHLAPLVAMLDRDPELGFAYSSCQYAGRLTLRVAPPKPARIDLGQPLFRRSILVETFPTLFPFREFAWDWRLIATLLERGVEWRHHDALSFIFRLEQYPQLMKALA